MKIISVVGARPNLMKTAPVMEAMKAQAERFDHLLTVHAQQSRNVSDESEGGRKEVPDGFFDCGA